MNSLFSHLVGFGPRSRHRSKIIRDADRLIRLWGTTAYDCATDLSAREDLGFISAGQPGHWWRVRAEIARRTGRQSREPAYGRQVGGREGLGDVIRPAP